jgi:hypothetical protein
VLTVDDTAWKAFTDDAERLQALLKHGLPRLHAQIDWSRGVEFLDKELLRVAPKEYANLQVVDKLFRVYLKNGTEEWILVHLEAQSTPDPNFAERMFAYHIAIWLRYRRRVLSIAILADDNPNWRPREFQYAVGECEIRFAFPTIKVLDLDEQQLLEAGDAASLILASFVRAVRTRHTPEIRLQARVELMQLALERGYNEEEIRQILAFLERAMRLPAELEEQYEKMLEEASRKQPEELLTSIERRAIRRGLLRGYRRGMQRGEARALRQAILGILRELYGEPHTELVHELNQIDDSARLLELQTAALRAGSIEAFQQRLREMMHRDEPSA